MPWKIFFLKKTKKLKCVGNRVLGRSLIGALIMACGRLINLEVLMESRLRPSKGLVKPPLKAHTYSEARG